MSAAAAAAAAAAEAAEAAVEALAPPGTSLSKMSSMVSAVPVPAARGRAAALGPADGTRGVADTIAAPAGTAVAALRPVRAGDFFLAGEGPRAEETLAPPVETLVPPPAAGVVCCVTGGAVSGAVAGCGGG